MRRKAEALSSLMLSRFCENRQERNTKPSGQPLEIPIVFVLVVEVLPRRTWESKGKDCSSSRTSYQRKSIQNVGTFSYVQSPVVRSSPSKNSLVSKHLLKGHIVRVSGDECSRGADCYGYTFITNGTVAKSMPLTTTHLEDNIYRAFHRLSKNEELGGYRKITNRLVSRKTKRALMHDGSSALRL